MSGACGPCTLCCNVWAISDPGLEKAAFVDCRHACAGGCEIYPDRPPSCRNFACFWLAANTGLIRRVKAMAEKYRPDRCGALFSLTPNDPGVMCMCDPARPWAFKKGNAAHVVQMFLDMGKPVLINTGRRKFIHTRQYGLEACDGADGQWVKTKGATVLIGTPRP